LKWYLLAANQGNVAAQLAVGAMYAKGRGIKQDYVEANRWFFSAGNKGNAFAQFNMGTAYEHGLGIQKDQAQAFKWFLRAAENGVAQAQWIVGKRYAEGWGTQQDSVKAYSWTNKAADQEFPPAIAARDEMVKTLTPTQILSAQDENVITSPRDFDPIPKSDQ
jgi:TPR repeat protein